MNAWRTLIIAVSWVFLPGLSRLTAEPAPFMMRATVDGVVIEGQPLAWSQEQMLLLGRDGILHEFHPRDAAEATKTNNRFVAYGSAEMQSRLRGELGRTFEVSATAHFVVAHPRDGGDWAQRLESLYRSYTHYMSVRGFAIQSPAVPLVAVVFRNQGDYYRHAAAAGTPLASGTLGHYDPQTNRIFLFDLQSVQAGADWSANAATIIHEATHQTAYNTGVHRRFAEQPRWLVEGLAMMFEAPGVWRAASHHTVSDRLNRERLDYYRRTADTRSGDWLPTLIASDRRFDSDALRAYAEAWSLSFYLCETRPQEYCRYLNRVANREEFSQYLPAERMADFTAVFGNDLKLLAVQLDRYLAALP